jgi:hypothetical protein
LQGIRRLLPFKYWIIGVFIVENSASIEFPL